MDHETNAVMERWKVAGRNETETNLPWVVRFGDGDELAEAGEGVASGACGGKPAWEFLADAAGGLERAGEP